MDIAPLGVISIDKPLGWTSHDVVAVCRGALGLRRVGHGGTLDPLATGVLPILAGTATKFVERLHAAPKVYAALVEFGVETATDDREGRVTREAPVPDIDLGVLEASLEAFRGEITQVPPDYSAIKVGGRAAYSRARAGESLLLKERSVVIERLDIGSWDPPRLRLLIVCSSGTYIRSLARDIGRALGSAARLGGLIRLAVGALEQQDSWDIARLRSQSRDDLLAALRPAGDELLSLDERFRTAGASELTDALTN